MIKLLFFLIFLLNLSSAYSHDPKNCDVLKNYDFSKFDDWKSEVIARSSEFDLKSDFVSDIIAPYALNKSVIENDKCQPEFTLTFSQYIDQRVSDLRIKMA